MEIEKIIHKSEEGKRNLLANWTEWKKTTALWDVAPSSPVELDRRTAYTRVVQPASRQSHSYIGSINFF